jgi:hypothetical protein
MEQKLDWKKKTLLIGGLVGLATGIVAAVMLIQRAEQQQSTPKLSAGEGVKLGLGVLGLLRLVSEYADVK